MILHTDVTGQGTPLVFLHTGLQTGLTDFELQADFFKGTYQVIRPDLRGQGSSIPFASHLVHSEQPQVYSLILEQFISRADGL